jgi:hypothetical protein
VKEEEEEMLELKDRLAAYSINDSSPDLRGNAHVSCL